MYGVVTRNVEELEWDEFDAGFYEVKDVTGRQEAPVETGVNMVSCHGDSAASKESELVPIDDEGRPATRDRKYFDWGYVCPTHERYREGLLTIIEECATVNEDVRLDDVGFPRQEYCFCDRCTEKFEESTFDDRFEWREQIITEFVADARDRVPGRLYLTVYPNPYPGLLRERSGLDFSELEPYVDEFVVPIYDMAYSTTYWIEILAQGFEAALSTPFSIELYAVQVDIENLVNATRVADAYAKDVFFGYDAGNARAVIRRVKADQRDGVTHGEPSG